MFTKKNLLALPLILAFCAMSHAENTTTTGKPQPIEKLDINRYVGQWHEIARLPVSFQKKCVSDVTANYSLNPDQSIKVINTCRTKEGTLDSSEGLAKSTNEGNTKLKVTFLPKGLRWIPFTKGDYWVLRLDENYQTVLVGGSSHKYLWILSRNADLDEATYQSYVATAKQQGYDVTKLIRTVQSK